MADPHYLNLLKHSWPSDRLVVSFISGKGISHFFTDILNTTSTTERVEEKRTNKHGLGLAPSARREKFMILSQHSMHLWPIAIVYSSEIPTKSPGMLTHPLTLANQASKSTGPSSHLLSLAGCPVLSTSLFCRLPWSADSSGLFWDLVFPRPLPVLHASPLCGFCAKTDKGIL